MPDDDPTGSPLLRELDARVDALEAPAPESWISANLAAEISSDASGWVNTGLTWSDPVANASFAGVDLARDAADAHKFNVLADGLYQLRLEARWRQSAAADGVLTVQIDWSRSAVAGDNTLASWVNLGVTLAPRPTAADPTMRQLSVLTWPAMVLHAGDVLALSTYQEAALAAGTVVLETSTGLTIVRLG